MLWTREQFSPKVRLTKKGLTEGQIITTTTTTHLCFKQIKYARALCIVILIYGVGGVSIFEILNLKLVALDN
jgi:hypothetical protein